MGHPVFNGMFTEMKINLTLWHKPIEGLLYFISPNNFQNRITHFNSCFQWKENPYFDQRRTDSAFSVPIRDAFEVLPDLYVQYQQQLGVDYSFLTSSILDFYISMPMIPKDTECLR